MQLRNSTTILVQSTNLSRYDRYWLQSSLDAKQSRDLLCDSPHFLLVSSSGTRSLNYRPDGYRLHQGPSHLCTSTYCIPIAPLVGCDKRKTARSTADIISPIGFSLNLQNKTAILNVFGLHETLWTETSCSRTSSENNQTEHMIPIE